MVPRATEIFTGSVGEMSSVPKAGVSVTAATGAGSAVVDAELELLTDSAADELADDESADAVTPAGLTDPLVGAARPVDDDGEQAAVATSTPAASRATAARRAGLER
ncbi:MAG: hypothetical protein ABWZ98_04090 [Nakamurella sp.]